MSRAFSHQSTLSTAFAYFFNGQDSSRSWFWWDAKPLASSGIIKKNNTPYLWKRRRSCAWWRWRRPSRGPSASPVSDRRRSGRCCSAPSAAPGSDPTGPCCPAPPPIPATGTLRPCQDKKMRKRTRTRNVINDTRAWKWRVVDTV